NSKFTNHKFQTNSKLQIPKHNLTPAVWNLRVGYWNLFVIWNLQLGAFSTARGPHGPHTMVPQSTGGRATCSPSRECATRSALFDSHTNMSTNRRPRSFSGGREDSFESCFMFAPSTPTATNVSYLFASSVLSCAYA